MDEIPEIQLTMNPKSPEARGIIGFKWNSTAGRAHKIGGQPDWLQGDETPECSRSEVSSGLVAFATSASKRQSQISVVRLRGHARDR